MTQSDPRGKRYNAAVISDNTSAEQRNAAVRIFSGKAKGEGPFAIFATTMKCVLEPQFVDIRVKLDGKKNSFSVQGVLDVQLESFKNPVTGEEQVTQVQLPKGFIWKVADAAETSVMWILTPNLNFDHSGMNAYVSEVEYRGP